MNKAKMIERVRKSINEPVEANSIVDDDEIYDYLFDGATIFIRETKCVTTFESFTTQQDQQDHILSAEVLKPIVLLWYDTSAWGELDYKTVKEALEYSDFKLFTEAGEPEIFFMEGKRQFSLHPIPKVDGGANDLKMLCSKMPSALATDESSWSEILTTYHRTIVHYASFECWDKIKDEAQSRKHYDLFYAGIDNYITDEQEKVKDQKFQKKVWTPSAGFISRL